MTSRWVTEKIAEDAPAVWRMNSEECEGEPDVTLLNFFIIVGAIRAASMAPERATKEEDAVQWTSCAGSFAAMKITN